jgi:hypothetical protein
VNALSPCNPIPQLTILREQEFNRLKKNYKDLRDDKLAHDTQNVGSFLLNLWKGKPDRAVYYRDQPEQARKRETDEPNKRSAKRD